MKKILRSIFIASVLLINNRAHASHLMGADISYECMGPGHYHIRLTLFRDCRGIAIGSTQIVQYSSAQCGVSSSVTLNQTSVSDITPVCPQQPNTLCSGGGAQYGVEKYIYEGDITLPPGCGTDWILSWNTCCRNAAITDLNSPDSQDMYVQTCGINNTISPCDNSPTFLNDPVPFFCVNQPVHYNHGVIDIDGDSIAFTPISPLTTTGNVNYSSGMSATNPFITSSGGAFNVNPVNGDINFTPSQQQIGVTAIRVDEYRNGVLIGCVMRDMQFTIINCTNTPPTATGINGSNVFNLTIPACSDTCFTIQSNDVDAGDIVTMTWNNGITGATFSAAGTPHPTGTFCWSTSAADVGLHSFTVNVRDNHCPITGNNTYSYNIRVVPSNDPPVDAGHDTTLCPGQSATLRATVSGGNVTNYAWSDGTNSWNTQSITVNPASTTIYTVTAYYPDGCQKSDAVVVTRAPNPNLSIFPANVTMCSGGSVNLLVSTVAQNPTYHWTPTTGLSCTNCPNPIATPSSSTQYCVYLTDVYNCPSNTVCSQINTASPPPPQSCAVLYATVNGNGNGTQANPASLQGAINLAQCNNSIIKLGTGTYTLDSAITNITSYTTLEGGFDPNTWIKTSAPGATTIYRSALNPEGVPNAPRIVGIYMNSSSFFRFQDVTFQTADCPNATSGQIAMSNYIFHMTNCSDYQFVRCRMLAGKGGNGVSGTIAGQAGLNATSGGTNGSSGDVDDDGVSAPGGNGGQGAGSSGGTGGSGGGANAAGSTGATAANYRDGGGGGGGGGGGQGSSDGGNGGAGGGGSVGGGGGGSGDPGGSGANGSGANGTNGNTGLNGSAGSFVGGFFIPGGQGGVGGDGQGGTGGSGGGGGGGQDCLFCTDGTGDGGGGGGGGGQGGTGGEGGWGGGASIAVYMYNNGANGVFTNDDFFLGTAGVGGSGAAGGAGGNGAAGGSGSTYGTSEVGAGGNGGRGGNGGNGGIGGQGASGSAGLVYVDGGTNPVTDLAFNLAAQPVINVADVSCTYRNVNFTSASSGSWDFGAASSPQTATGSNVNTLYTTYGRKDIIYSSNVYTGFFNVAIDAGSYIPEINTNAHQLSGDTFILCRGSTADFNAIIAGADTFDWNFGGAVSPNTYTGMGSAYQNLSNLIFNTVGTFKITLRVSTSCCGWSPSDSIYMVVEPNPTLSFNGLYAFCPGDSVTLTASGATTYTWSPPTGLNTTAGATVVARPTSTTTYLVTGLSPRGYCVVDSQIMVSVSSPPTLSFITVPATCGANGSIIANPTPAGNYSYSWSDAAHQTAQTAVNLPSGSYSVTVTDLSSNCTTSDATALGAGGGILAYIDSSANTSCYGFCDGYARVVGIGASGNYSYSWSNGATNTSISNVCANNYTVSVTDIPSGCIATASAIISQPPAVFITVLDSVNATCLSSANGSAKVDAGGGTGLYQFFWSDSAHQDSSHAVNLLAGTYTVTAIDANGCTASASVNISSSQIILSLVGTTPSTCYGSPDGGLVLSATNGTPAYWFSIDSGTAQTDSIFSGVRGGSHLASVTDSNSCVDTLTVNVPQPAQTIFLDTSVTDVNCFGENNGAIDLAVTGASGPWTFVWNTGATTEDISGLSAGFYRVTVTDNINCTGTGIDSIHVNQPNVLSLAQTTQNVNCFGGSDGCITITVSGGTPAYNYLWSNNGADTSQLCGLSTGTFSVTVSDAHNCSDSIENISVTQPTALAVNPIVTNVSCPGFSDGSIDANASGGTTIYSYSWSNNAGDVAVNANIPAGIYEVTVTDANLCSVSASDTLIELPGIAINATVHDVLCEPLHNGFVEISAQTFHPPLSYLWSNGATTENIYSLGDGIFSVTLTDANNCVVDTSFTIVTDSVWAIEIFPSDTTIDLGNSVNITTVPSWGNVASVVWTPSTGLNCTDCVAPNAAPVESIYYVATAVSDSGCVASDRVNITVVPEHIIYIPNVFTPNQDGNNDYFEVYGNKDAWKEFEVQIFDRWGEKVFDSNDMNFKWDGIYKGKPLMPAVFVYQIHIVYLDNYTDKIYKGSVTLLR